MRNVPVAIVLIIGIVGLFVFSCTSLDRPEDPRLSGENAAQLPIKPFTAGGPYLEVDIPACASLNPALVPPIATFEWGTLDGAPDPDMVRWILVSTRDFNLNYNQTLDYIRQNPNAPEWSQWQPYDPANGVGTLATIGPLNLGPYVFAVHGREDGMAPSEDFEFNRNAVRVRVSARSTGPLLTLTSDFMNPIRTSTKETPVTVVELPPGTPAEFCWTGDASAYCGVVRAYRYGWDMTDLGDLSQWEVDFTPYDGEEICAPPRIFYFGTHTFVVDVLDNSGFLSRIPVTINIPATPIAASLDIRPGACPNPVNPKAQGVLGMALLGTADIDVHDVDISTIMLQDEGFTTGDARPGQHMIRDVMTAPGGGANCACPVRGPDGYDDLHLKFRMDDVAPLLAGSAMGDELRLGLVGLLHDGTPFVATDCVRIVGFQPPEEPPPPASGPDTQIFRVMNTYFSGGQKVVEEVDFTDSEPDTVPYGSWLTLFYNGIPSSGPSLCTDDENKCLRFQKNYTRRSSSIPGETTTRWMPDEGEDNNPHGTADSTSLNMGTVQYTVRIRTVDEFGTPDPTPAAVNIVGNLRPTLDDYRIRNYDGTVVRDGDEVIWDWWNPANYHGNMGDTLDFSDPTMPRVRKEFYFLIKGDGHDHPKEADHGGVKSWFYTFRRADDPSYLQPFARSGIWVGGLATNVVCDTVRLVVLYSFLDDPGGTAAWENLPDWLNREYDLSIRGRDTGLGEEFEQFMFVWGNRLLINRYPVGPLGRETGEGHMRFRLTIDRSMGPNLRTEIKGTRSRRH